MLCMMMAPVYRDPFHGRRFRGVHHMLVHWPWRVVFRVVFGTLMAAALSVDMSAWHHPDLVVCPFLAAGYC